MGEEGTGRKKWTELMGLGRDPWTRLWARRAVTIPLYFVLCGLMVALTPVLFPLALIVDALRSSKWASVRMIAFLILYFVCEVLGILASFVLWLLAGPYISRDVEGYLRKNFVLQCWWARTLAGGAFKLFSIQLEVEGLRDFRGRPILLFARHASTADTVLPAMLIGDPQKIMLRYIIKRELLVDPCLDIVGNRLPNYFVRRGSGEGAKEIEAIGQLMDDLSPGQGVLMYPEGTRFSATKRERILKRLEASGDRDAVHRVRDMPHVLPPRLGGSLALLERNEGADAVFCVHTGLEPTTSILQLWRGELVGSRVRVRFWVVPFEDIPKGREALSEWLWAEWAKANAFLEENKGKEVC
jgi:1-acyl-sn-glycerol-3-phosphate acyltransferase